MSTKIEAKRFSGKAGTWQHYEMAVHAHFAVQDWTEFFNDGTDIADAKRADWRKAQQKIYSHFILTCDDRAATTLLSVKKDQEAVGWAAYQALQDKYGDAKDQGLSKLCKKFFNRKQGDEESTQDYLNIMKSKVTEIERVANGDGARIWRVLQCTALVQNLRHDEEGKLTKKLLNNRMAEAEADGKTLDYEKIESIIANDADNTDEPAKPKKPKPQPQDDLALLFKGGKHGGRGGGKWSGKGKPSGNGGRGNGGKGKWQPQWQPQQQPWHQPWHQPYKGGGKHGAARGPDKGPSDTAAALEQLKSAQKEYDKIKKKEKDDMNWAGEEHYPRQQQQSSSRSIDDEGYWSMHDRMYSADDTAGEADGFRVFSPKMGRNDINKISRILGKLPSMHARLEWLHTHMYIS